MNIEIINTGSELLLGSTLNTHGAWMGLQLSEIGLRVRRQVTVPDGVAIRSELERALAEDAENDVIFVTGGIGPTTDDITREETAHALGIELIEDEFAVRCIRAFFEQRGKEMAECNLKQAQSPCGADILPNPNGTAPGIYVPPRLGNSPCAVFLLPGPPSELKPMFREEVTHRLKALMNNEKETSIQVLSFVDIGESDFHQAIDEKLQSIPDLEVGYCARPKEIDLRLIGSEESIEQAKSITLEAFGDKCFTQNGESLEQVIIQKLTETNKSISTIESCTGGAIASRLTDVSGSSAVFSHGFVTYSNDAKEQLVEVNSETLNQHGAVSQQVAQEMAEGALNTSGADIAISVTGIAGPTGGTEAKPVGTVWMGLARKNQATLTWKEFHPKSRSQFKAIVCQSMLTKVWHILK